VTVFGTFDTLIQTAEQRQAAFLYACRRDGVRDPTVGDGPATCGFGVRLHGTPLATLPYLWVAPVGGASCLVRRHARIKVPDHDR
jgi:hypothetical protein